MLSYGTTCQTIAALRCLNQNFELLERKRCYAFKAERISGAVQSIFGQQVQDALAAAELELSAEQWALLEESSRVRLGEPHDHNNFHAYLGGIGRFARNSEVFLQLHNNTLNAKVAATEDIVPGGGHFCLAAAYSLIF